MDVQRSTLCSFCERISPTTTWFYHYPNFSALQASAQSCPICELLLAVFEPDVFDKVLQAAKDPDNYAKVIIRRARNDNTRENQVGDFAVQQVEIVTRGHYFHSNTFVVNCHGGPFSDRSIWRSAKPVTFEESFPVLNSWFAECTSGHSLCSKEPGELPTRVLSVNGDDASTVRLEITRGQKGKYAALSHCWGTVQDNIRTTRDNLHQHLQEISIASLPKTFKDAVLLARKLKIPYLWIDSLCIIQDDNEDWQKEAGIMAAVFHNAYLTMAATASEDSNGGCFFPRGPAMHIKANGVNSKAEEVSTTTYVRYPAEESRSLMQSPLFRRGWVLQEMVLSQRTVHFAHDQLFWHCRSRITSEDGYFDARLATTFFDLETPEKAHQSWWTWVEDYSNRKLPREADKFAALAGLTKSFPSAGKPIAGLWSDDVHFGLLWCTKGPSTRSSLRGVPSWSWASVNGPVRSLISRSHTLWIDHSAGIIKQTKLLDAEVKWSSSPLTSSILHASLALRTRINIAVLQGVENQDAVTNKWFGSYKIQNFNFHQFAKLFFLIPHITDFDDRVKDFSGYCCFDLEPPETGSHILCLLLSTEECDQLGQTDRNQKPKKKCYDEEGEDAKYKTCSHQTNHILLVESTGRVADEYRRIGVGTVTNGITGTSLFEDMEEIDITLV